LLEVAQPAVEFALEDWPKIDGPDEPIPELDAEPVWPRDLERLDRVNRVSHASLLPQRLNLARQAAGLEAFPSSDQLRLMNLGPGFDEPPLPLRKAACNELDEVDREDANFIMVVRMEVRAMMRPGRLSEHTDDNPEKSSKLWHSGRLHLSSTRSLASFYPVMHLTPVS